MGNVVYYMSMSLDGFVTAAGVTPEAGLGVGGERLHDWGTDPEGSALLEQVAERSGAAIVGRRTYDLSLPAWGPDGPTGKTRLPTFVVTHRETPPPPADGVYTFVTDGIDSAVSQAKEAAGTRDVGVSGADVGRQLLQAGLVDEVRIFLVPVLFGDGTRLYEHAGGHHLELDLVESVPTPSAIHLHYRPRKA